MAHQIESIFSLKQTPWHGLGTVVADAPTAADAIKLAALDWPVELKPVYLSDGRQAPANAVIRGTDQSILGVVGPRWHPLQNADAFAWFNPFVEAGECSFETAGSLQHGKRVWILASLNRPESEIAPGDAVRKFLLLSNSHDGTLAVRVGFTPIRVVCANTLAMAHGDAASQLIRLRHTKNLSAVMAEVRDAVNLANERFEATAEHYRRLAASNVASREDLRKYVKQVLDLTDETKPNASPALLLARSGLTARSAETLAAVLSNFDGAGKGADLPGSRGTWWGAYNAVTEYLAYNRGRTNDTRLDALWFGESARINAKALTTALDLAA